MLERADIDGAVGLAEPHQVQRSEIARRVVQEHVLRTRVGRIDASGRGATVPVVDGRIELHAGIGRMPGCLGDAVPQGGGAHGLGDLAARALGQRPVAVGLDRTQKLVGDPHRVVRVLAGYRGIGLGLPVGVESWEFDMAVALAGELDDPRDVVLRQLGLAGGHDLAPQPEVSLRVERCVAFAVETGLHDGIEVPVGQS